MARTELTRTRITRSGIALTADTAADTTNGNMVPNDGRVIIMAENTDTVGHTLTAVIPGTVDGIAQPDRTEDIAAGALLSFGPYPVADYGNTLGIDTSSNLVNLSAYSIM